MLFKKQKWLLMTMLLGLILSAGCANADDGGTLEQDNQSTELKAQIEQMNTHAKRMYDYMKLGDIVEARTELLKIEETLKHAAFDDTLTDAGYEAVQTTVFEARKTFNAVKFNKDQGMVHAAKVRLLFDAMIHEHQPMWLQYYKVLKNDTKQLQQAVDEGNLTEVKNALTQLEYHYMVVRPAALVQRDSADIIKCDSLFTFMHTALKEQNLDQLGKGTGELKAVWGDLFDKENKPAYGPIVDHKQPIYWTLGIGSAIFTVLAFVGWRKFHYSKGYIAVKRPNGDDR
jgi:sporulation protein YpjB